MGTSRLMHRPGVNKKNTEETRVVYLPFFQNHLSFYSKSRVNNFRFLGGFCTFKKTPGVQRARGTLFWPKIARELTKSNGTRTIRSEIARGIVSNRSRGPEMHKMKVFDTPTCMEVALQVPRYDNSKGGFPREQIQNRGAILIFFSFVTSSR